MKKLEDFTIVGLAFMAMLLLFAPYESMLQVVLTRLLGVGFGYMAYVLAKPIEKKTPKK